MAVLRLNDGSLIVDPSADQIGEILSSLAARSYAILSRSDDVYIQTKPAGNGRFIVEYQDGSLDEHYESTWGASLTEVIAVFDSYQRGDESWRLQLTWQRLDLETKSSSS